MSELMLFEGRSAYSAFRLGKFAARLGVAQQSLYAEYVHLVAVDEPMLPASGILRFCGSDLRAEMLLKLCSANAIIGLFCD